MFGKPFLVCLAALLISAVSSMAQVIEAGRAISITISSVPSDEKVRIDGLYPVSQNGNVNMPFIGQIRAAGMTPEAFANSLQSAYRSQGIYRNPTIQVISSDSSTITEQMVHVGGQVRRPGPVKYVQGLTLYQAVQSAGGPTEFGSMGRVTVFRGGKQNTYDLNNANDMRIGLQPNDTIDVPQKNFLGR